VVYKRMVCKKLFIRFTLVVAAAGVLSASASLNISTTVIQGPACSASLPDNQSLVTGGTNAKGPVSIAAYFSGKTTLTSAAPMLTPRAGHVCIALKDNTVLVAGGQTPDGPTNSAEIFHPDTNTWSPAGSTVATRKPGAAAAVLLSNGQALVAGGGTFEIFDPERSTFQQVRGTFSAERTHYAMAALPDKRVVIAGGLEGDRALDSIDVFDPERGAVYPVGRMLTPRADFTATTLLDGTVLFAGGTDGTAELASTEIYDPVKTTNAPGAPLLVPRHSHIAVSVHGGKTVLIAGGKSQGQFISFGELLIVGQHAFQPAMESPEDAPSTNTVSVADVAPDGTVRNAKKFRIPQAAPARKIAAP
jgi:hypothetical protein